MTAATPATAVKRASERPCSPVAEFYNSNTFSHQIHLQRLRAGAGQGRLRLRRRALPRVRLNGGRTCSPKAVLGGPISLVGLVAAVAAEGGESAAGNVHYMRTAGSDTGRVSSTA